MKQFRYYLFACCFGTAFLYFQCHNIGGDLKYDRIDPDCPRVTGLEPANGAAAGDTVKVKGANFFIGDPRLYELKIGQTAVEVLERVNDSTLSFIVPHRIVDGRVTVGLPGFTCNAILGNEYNDFVYHYTAESVSVFAGVVGSSNCAECISTPLGLEVDEAGGVWVASLGHIAVVYYDSNGVKIRKIGKRNPGMTPCDCADLPGTNDTSVCYLGPTDLVSGTGGAIFVAESGNIISRIEEPRGKSRFAGTCATSTPVTDSICTASILSAPSRIAYSNKNNTFYFIDNGELKTIENDCIVRSLHYPNQANQKIKAVDVNDDIEIPGIEYVARPVILLEQGSGNPSYSIVYLDKYNIAKQINLEPYPFSSPEAIVVDRSGNVFIADKNKRQIFVVYRNGIMKQLKGTEDTIFDRSAGLALDEKSGTLYVSDSQKHIIRKIKINKRAL